MNTPFESMLRAFMMATFVARGVPGVAALFPVPVQRFDTNRPAREFG
jgi:hypothetical protein